MQKNIMQAYINVETQDFASLPQKKIRKANNEIEIGFFELRVLYI